jgi:hypothetical protein
MIHEWFGDIVALDHGLKVGDLANAIHVYPTYSMAGMQAAAAIRVEQLLSGTSGVNLIPRPGPPNEMKGKASFTTALKLEPKPQLQTSNSTRRPKPYKQPVRNHIFHEITRSLCPVRRLRRQCRQVIHAQVLIRDGAVYLPGRSTLPGARLARGAANLVRRQLAPGLVQIQQARSYPL